MTTKTVFRTILQVIAVLLTIRALTACKNDSTPPPEPPHQLAPNEPGATATPAA